MVVIICPLGADAHIMTLNFNYTYKAVTVIMVSVRKGGASTTENGVNLLGTLYNDGGSIVV